jgi:hypothetical protein
LTQFCFWSEKFGYVPYGPPFLHSLFSLKFQDIQIIKTEFLSLTSLAYLNSSHLSCDIIGHIVN